MSVPSPNGRKWPVAILGATGAVGQTFIRLLADHPWFEVAEVAASERRRETYAEAARWIEGEMPESVAGMIVQPADPQRISSRITFSALDSSVAATSSARLHLREGSC